MQLGKKGLTQEFIENLKKAFLKNENIRISVLKSGTRDRAELKQMADKILGELGKNYTCTIIGYTLVLRKWRKARA
jgi:RNA-binding protein YhbY